MFLIDADMTGSRRHPKAARGRLSSGAAGSLTKTTEQQELTWSQEQGINYTAWTVPDHKIRGMKYKHGKKH